MTMRAVPGVEGETSVQALIADAIAVLAAEGVPALFAGALLNGAAPEDVALLSRDALVRLTRAAYAHLRSRPRGHHDIRVYNPDWEGAPAITVIETVNDDMSFLFDSVAGELADRGLDLRLTSHPILAVQRDAAGTLEELEGDLHSAKGRSLPHESVIHLHIAQLESDAALADLKAALDRTLADVRACNMDFLAMRDEVRALAKACRVANVPYSQAERNEAAEFIEWLAGNNFIFLGVRRYGLGADGALVPESGLGILRDPAVKELGEAQGRATLPSVGGEAPLLITKSALWSRVHRRAYTDFIGMKLHAADGRETGELHIVGLFTSNVYTHSARHIPYLRLKTGLVLARAGLEEDSHSGKALATVLETYPRDDLFQIDAETLLPYALDILSLYDRPRVRVLPRPDAFGRFVSVLVYVPRERFDSTLRQKIGERLAEAFGGKVEVFTPIFLADVPLTRVHFILSRDGGPVPAVNRADLERQVGEDVLSWGDRLRDALRAAHGPQARLLMERYGAAFGEGYSAAYDIETAVADIERLERLSPERPVALDFYRRPDEPATRIALRLISHGRPLPLSERVPMLENMGLKAINERTYRLRPAGEGTAPSWVHDMTLERSNGGTIEVSGSAERLEDLLTAVLRGEAENDGFNALLLDTGLGWRDVALARALGRYLRQAGIPYSQDYLWTTLVGHADIAEKIIALFHARFDPRLDAGAEARAAREEPLRKQIEAALAEVSSLDEDTILRRFLNLVDAALRTSYYQLDSEGRAKGVIAIKYESAKVEGLPLPRPLFEVFVYSPRVEGVHLRFGHVARGGLRWSDRPQDFRTEVLGLVKAQQVKNAVIVPVGAKGGFVPKRLPAGGSRDAIQAEGIAAYKLFVSSLLDITDNLKGGDLVYPENVVRLDGDDPYLVVAADKGTATFSDTANGISQEHGFWLDDAFASGGSVGYDHKAMGITARGAWEAVKRHFREIDIDIQETPIRVAGVGDMSGDVFGNGMLLSRALKLVAAFDHRHIFLDPTPDPAVSFAERQRLFNLPRSSWADYDASLISQGGGIYPRTAKSIPLSAEVRALLGLNKMEATPNEVMTAILKAEVDLLWFGGIGTYVRASSETDAQAGDRANDAIRIAASDLRVKVVGEGANLGMTQRGRIEAGRRGVRLNTDAIDNSAGVNTSDVEVNIKIALSTPVAEGVLNAPDRAALLGEMTDEVGHLVLRNNYLQTLALSLAQRSGTRDTAFQQRLMQMLEVRGELDRAVEYLPQDSEIQERRARGEALTRPELAVLLAYAKLSLYSELLASDVPDDAYLADELVHYFPHALQSRFPDAITSHRLRREIIATQLANDLINQGGPATIARIADQTGADAASIARAFLVVRDSFGVPAINAAINALDARISGEVQLGLYAEVQDLTVARTIWVLRNVSLATGVGALVTQYRTGIEALEGVLDETLPANWLSWRDGKIAQLVAAQVPEEVARKVASLRPLGAGTDIARLAQTTGRTIAEAASTFFAAGLYFSGDEIIAAAGSIVAPDYYDRLAMDRAVGQIETFVRDVSVGMLGTGKAGADAVEAWVDSRRREVERTRATVKDIVASGLTLSKLTLAASLLADLARA